METSEQREVETKKTAVADDGRVIQERTRSVDTQVGSKTIIINLIWFVYGLIGVLLIGRFILKLTGANGTTGFVRMLYSVTDVLSKPFDAIFGVTNTGTNEKLSVFEPSIIVAIAVYGLIAWGIVRLLNIDQPSDDSSV